MKIILLFFVNTILMSVLSLAYLGIRRVFGRKLSHSATYFLGTVVCCMFLLPIGLIPIGQMIMLQHHSSRNTANINSPANIGTVSDPKLSEVSDGVAVPIWKAEENSGVGVGNAVVLEPVWRWMNRHSEIVYILTAVWLGAAIFLGMGRMLRYKKISKEMRRFWYKQEQVPIFLSGKHNWDDLPIYRCDLVTTPMVFGLGSPKILLPPEAFASEIYEYCVCHEAIHYRRKDVLVHWILSAINTLFWFDPVVSMLFRAVCAECELSCDYRAIRNLSEKEKKAYGRTLLFFAERQVELQNVGALAFVNDAKEMEKRIYQISGKNRMNGKLAILCSGILVAGIALSGCAMVGESSKMKELKYVKDEVTFPNPVFLPRQSSVSTDGEEKEWWDRNEKRIRIMLEDYLIYVNHDMVQASMNFGDSYFQYEVRGNVEKKQLKIICMEGSCYKTFELAYLPGEGRLSEKTERDCDYENVPWMTGTVLEPVVNYTEAEREKKDRIRKLFEQFAVDMETEAKGTQYHRIVDWKLDDFYVRPDGNAVLRSAWLDNRGYRYLVMLLFDPDDESFSVLYGNQAENSVSTPELIQEFADFPEDITSRAYYVVAENPERKGGYSVLFIRDITMFDERCSNNYFGFGSEW